MCSKVPWASEEAHGWLEETLSKMRTSQRSIEEHLAFWDALGIKDRVLSAFKRFVESPEGKQALARLQEEDDERS